MMNVAVLAAALAVDVTNFVTACASSAQAYKTATLLKTLNVNALISGEVGVGKKTLARYILNDAPMFDGSEYEDILATLQSTNEIIIVNLENVPNIKIVLDTIVEKSIRLIATAKSSFYSEYIDEVCSIKFDIPPLNQRPDDVNELIKIYAKEASKLFNTSSEIKLDNLKPDLSSNSNSLKRQIMINSLFADISDIELMDIVQSYLTDKLGSNNDYRNFLHIYEVPLIRAGLEKFKSQLQLADKLGLNRNTLRKKISDNKEYL
ncbi:MAG: Fis family transcriptional regulator [Thiovulaceae bacterium]|nr:Fis family transcriptional regulator [Sulfurimonadaceae bacterium]MCW9026486.1 Fis family transcriptional regulator [Sulfurimonadaceae bacterium]